MQTTTHKHGWHMIYREGVAVWLSFFFLNFDIAYDKKKDVD